MAGIKISKTLKKKLPLEAQNSDLETTLWEMSAGLCHLCGEPMNRTTDDIEADHDQPASEDGATTIENLNLAHKSCNAAKRSHPTIEVRPYLKLDAFIKKQSNPVRYGECAALFGIIPQPVFLTYISTDLVEFELPGSKQKVPIYHVSNSDGSFDYCFVELPREAIFNDDECQPRNIKKAQVWAIYQDLQKNPLHEPPGCRIVPDGSRHKLLMFDGQHKTVASWMCGYKSIVAKVYLDLNLHQTTRLVNSVQAKIKKLPLSPFEVAAKLGDEWEQKWAAYESEVGTEQASEDGFLSRLDLSDRKRAMSAFEEARLQQLLERDELTILKFIKKAGIQETDNSLIPEATFKNKILKVLVYGTPTKDQGEDGALKRTHEADNIVRVLNYFSERVFEPGGAGVELTPEQLETRRRFVYQGSLKFSAEMLQKIVQQCCSTDEDGSAFFDARIDDERWGKITTTIDRFVKHPIWTKDFDIGPKTKAVREALSKNQQVKESFKSVGLTVGYALGADALSSNWFK